MPPHIRLAPFTAVAFSRKSAVLSAVGVLLIILGCMHLNGGSMINDDGTFTQEFTTNVAPGAEIEIFYPVPYTTTPHLVIDDEHGDCIVTDQQPNHFRIRNRNPQYSRNVTWKARGVRVPPGVVVPVPQGPPQGPPRGPMMPPQPLPSQPLPQPLPTPTPVPGPSPGPPAAQLGQPR